MNDPFPPFIWPVLLVNNGHQIWSVMEMDTKIFNVKIHVAIEDEVIDFILRDRVAPVLFHFLRRLIGNEQGISKSGEVPNPGVELPRSCPLVADDNVALTGHIAALISYKVVGLTLHGGTLDIAKIDWNCKCLRLALEVWWPLVNICQRELTGNYTVGVDVTPGFKRRQ